MIVITITLCVTLIIISFVVCVTIENIKNNKIDSDSIYNELLCDVKHIYLRLVHIKSKLRYDMDLQKEIKQCIDVLESFVEDRYLEEDEDNEK